MFLPVHWACFLLHRQRIAYTLHSGSITAHIEAVIYLFIYLSSLVAQPGLIYYFPDFAWEICCSFVIPEQMLPKYKRTVGDLSEQK